MNQHKDLLYRQKYATYQLNNRTFSTQNTKILAHSLAISYICFQVRIVKKKAKKKAILSTTTENLATPAPPTRALYAKLQREKLQFLSLLTTILKALICWKLESFRGLGPLGPRQGLCPCTPPGPLRRAPWREFFFLRHFCPWLKISIYWRNKPQPHSCVCVCCEIIFVFTYIALVVFVYKVKQKIIIQYKYDQKCHEWVSNPRRVTGSASLRPLSHGVNRSNASVVLHCY